MMHTIEGLIRENERLRAIIIMIMGQVPVTDFSEDFIKEIKEALECKQ
jgi:hypothetical protein